jgi:hypothetical protein
VEVVRGFWADHPNAHDAALHGIEGIGSHLDAPAAIHDWR